MSEVYVLNLARSTFAQLTFAQFFEDFYQQTAFCLEPIAWWRIVRSPEDEVVGIGREKQEWPMAPFTTGFENASAEILQRFVLEKSTSSEGNIYGNIYFECDQFFILDSRSAEDNAGVFWYHLGFHPLVREYDEDWNESDGYDVVHTWVSWRIPFSQFWGMATGFWHVGSEMMDIINEESEAYTDDTGVTHFPSLEARTMHPRAFESNLPK